MKAFHTIAVPHADILSGKLTMDVFAADLWEVLQKRAPDEYQDPHRFFEKTYLTDGLKNLLGVVEKRLSGKGGDPVIQVQTPFGGGKTHSLISMFHKSAEWKSRCAVIVGTALAPTDTIWGILSEQLTGSRAGFEGMAAPGREAVRNLLAENQPLLILMDEVLEYATKAAGIMVGKSTLASQTIAFLHELSETVATLERTCLVITLPASVLEHYDENAEQLFRQLQKVSGRVEKIYTPVQEYEISRVIRQRLFARINEKEMKNIVNEFMEYAEKEGLIPPGIDPSEYRRRFEDAYPFLQEVIDVLYQRWGSFSSFQRTRGVLRLLSLVIYSHRESSIPYFTLSDFDLANQEIRRELLKHIGPEYDSVIANDITNADAGAPKVDEELGDAYRGLRLGSRTATAIFMYSFSGGVERGATLGEVKRHATTLQNPSSVIAEALELLKSRLFFLQQQSGKTFFTNQPNLNRILINRMEDIKDHEIEEAETDLLQKRLKGQHFRVYLWPQQDVDIPDSPEIKLIILKDASEEQMMSFLTQKGSTPRVHRNTLFFLTPMENEYLALERLIRRYLGFRSIQDDSTLKLTEEQKTQVKNELKQLEKDLTTQLRRAYRVLYLPARDSQLRSLDMGVPTYGMDIPLDEEVYEKLRTEGEILVRLEPLVIKERYLTDKDYILTEQLVKNWSRTPGELRVINEESWRKSIAEGVKQGLFGLGILEGDQPQCIAVEKESPVALTGSEVIIRAEICKKQRAAYEPPREKPGEVVERREGISPGEITTNVPPITTASNKVNSLNFKFQVPKGKVASLLGLLNLLQQRFNTMFLSIQVKDGEMSKDDIENKIKETFRQMGVNVEGLDD